VRATDVKFDRGGRRMASAPPVSGEREFVDRSF
jgi:hypothetical protein